MKKNILLRGSIFVAMLVFLISCSNKISTTEIFNLNSIDLNSYYKILKSSNHSKTIHNMLNSIDSLSKYEKYYCLLLSYEILLNTDKSFKPDEMLIIDIQPSFYEKGKMFYDKYPSEVIAMLCGLFCDGAIAEAQSSVVNDLFIKDNYKYIKALTFTNITIRYYNSFNIKYYNFIYTISLFNYNTNISISNFIENNNSDLNNLKNKFDKTDIWVFDKLQFNYW